MVDDGASACITNDKNDFVGTPKTISRKVNGINGQAQATHRGTVRWLIEDDNGMTYVFTINGTYLVPTASTRILSPQRLAQQAQDHYPRVEGMGSTTLSKNIMLFWNQRKHTKTVPLDPKLNVGITTTGAGAKKYKQYRSKMTTPETKEVNIFETHVIPPEDEDDNVSLQPEDPVQNPVEEDKAEAPQAEMPQPPQTQEFEVPESLVNVIPDDKVPKSLEPQDELL